MHIGADRSKAGIYTLGRQKRPQTFQKLAGLISYTSFISKRMEQIIDRHIRDEVLPGNLLNENQHANQYGKSTTHALKKFSNQID